MNNAEKLREWRRNNPDKCRQHYLNSKPRIKRWREETKKAPRSFRDAFDAALPPGVPKGSVQVGVSDLDGAPVYRLPDGSEKVYR